MIDTGYVQTGAAVVDSDHLAPGCGGADATIDNNINSRVCLNPGYVVLDFNPAGASPVHELWIKVYGACGSLNIGYGPLVFSLYNWNTNQFDEVKTYNEAYTAPMLHWIEFKVDVPLTDLVASDGKVRLKIYAQQHNGTSARIHEVYVRAIHEGAGIEVPRVDTMPVIAIDGVGTQYAHQLTNQGIDTVTELYMIYPEALSPLVNLSVARLYEFQRKAHLAMHTKFERAVYAPVFEWKLEDIIGTPDNDIRSQTGITVAQITEMKRGIATLFVALDNAAIEDLTLRSFEVL